MKGKFIVFEGIDGSGQSTQIELLKKYLSKKHDCVLTKEPTNNLLGGIIRAALRREWKTDLRTLQLLFSADRCHHLEFFIKPALEKGKWVLSDRYFLSTIAYGALELEWDWLKNLSSKFLVPDIIFILDVPEEVSLKRIDKSRASREFFEEKEKLRKVRSNYMKIFEEMKHEWNIFIIDGTKTIEQIHDEIKSIVDDLTNNK